MVNHPNRSKQARSALDYIQDNTFAAACYNQNSIAELEAALAGPVDKTDCETWGITPGAWRRQIALALDALREDAEQS